MSTPTIVYIPVPVSEKPEKDGWYTIVAENAIDLSRWFDSERGWDIPETEYAYTYWLKPVQISSDSPVQKVIDWIQGNSSDIESSNMRAAMQMVADYLKHNNLPADLARSARIQQLEQDVETFKDAMIERNDAYNKSCVRIKELETELKKFNP
jgi:hypothetical protein